MAAIRLLWRCRSCNPSTVLQRVAQQPMLACSVLTLLVTPAGASSSSISLHWEQPEEDNGSPVTGYLLESASTSGRVAPVYQKAYSGKDTRCTVGSSLPVAQDQAPLHLRKCHWLNNCFS